MTVFCPLSTQPVFYQGRPQVGAQVTFYDAGTLTPRVAYSDGLLHEPWQQPLLTDASSCIPPAWLQGLPYRVRILTATGILIRDLDNMPGDPAAPPPPPPVGSLDKPLMTGDLVWNYGTAIITGRVRCNGKSIGSELSGATEFADPTAQNLYVWLWDQDSTLPVQGGRGATAAADFAADKPLTLPDFSGRTPFMLDASASGRLNGVPFLAGNATQLGSTLGEGLHLSIINEMPIFTVTATTASGGAHQHTGTTNANPLIQVNEVTDVQGVHAHGGLTAAAGAYTPTGTTDTQGLHSHGGGTGGDTPAHTHGYLEWAGYSIGAPGSSNAYWYGTPLNGQTAGPSNPHTHGIGNDGQHAHNLQLNAAPAHTHGISADGSHQHNVPDTTQPHTHPFTTDTGGAHQHTLTTDPVGGNTPHNTVPPAILVTFYLVL
jgi:hypothetical protein